MIINFFLDHPVCMYTVKLYLFCLLEILFKVLGPRHTPFFTSYYLAEDVAVDTTFDVFGLNYTYNLHIHNSKEK